MITKFDSSYAGHVDMENVGYAGTAVNDRRFSDDHLASAFDNALAIAQILDRCGYDTFWMAEHHFQTEGYECIPNVLMLSLHLAHLTKSLNFGCGFNITPMWHPLRLAEDYATADILTNGRVIFGVGRGYHTREVETFGAPLLDQLSNRELFEEQVEIILKAFNERAFSHVGQNYAIPPEIPYRGYDLKEITLVPRPKSLPVECWQPISSGNQRGLDFMARNGIKGLMSGGLGYGSAMDAAVESFQEAQARFGNDTVLGENLSISYQMFMDSSKEKAISQAAKYFEENLKMFAPLRLVRSLSDEKIAAMSDPELAPNAGLPTIEQAVASGGFLCGTPEMIIESLKKLEHRYPGLERVSVSHPIGTPHSLILDQLEWFATDVIPAFKPIKNTDTTLQ